MEWSADERSFSVAAGDETTARIATFYYPYWTAEVNGVRTAVEKGEDGAINLPLPPTDVEVKLFFQEPGFLAVFRIISILTWLGLILGIFLGRKPFPANRRPTDALP